MLINTSGLFAVYHEAVDALTNQINNTDMILHFAPLAGLSSVPGSTSNMPVSTVDYFGGSAPVSSLQGRINENAQQKYPETRTNDIKVRAYWTTSKYDPVLKALRTDKGESILKVNSYTTDNQKLRDAQYAIVNGQRVVMTDPPIPYGFDKRSSISYWKIS